MLTAKYPFSYAEMNQAYASWGCNCGPSALAFALQKTLDEVHPFIPQFDEKQYTSPSMMAAALSAMGIIWSKGPKTPTPQDMFDQLGRVSLVRIQWTGPWTAPNANPRWAYRQTHWIACFLLGKDNDRAIFDCNGGIRSFLSWVSDIVPQLVSQIPRADFGWTPTHVWTIDSSLEC